VDIKFLEPTSIFQVISSIGIISLCIAAFLGWINRVKIGNVEIDLNKRTAIPNSAIAELYKAVSVNKESISELVKITGDIRREFSEFKFSHQKQFFYDKDQRTDERLLSGLRYIKLGGNGEVRKDVIAFIKANRQIYDAICSADKSLRLREEDLHETEK